MSSTPPKKHPDQLRSARWFAPDDLRSFGHRSRAMQMGYAPQDWAGKPVIAIVNTWSDINPCHTHFKQRVEDVKRGIFQAGGFPLELPAISLAEAFVRPTTMLYRNMLVCNARMVETGLHKALWDNRNRLWRCIGAGSYYNRPEQIKEQLKNAVIATVFVVYAPVTLQHRFRFASSLPLCT